MEIQSWSGVTYIRARSTDRSLLTVCWVCGSWHSGRVTSVKTQNSWRNMYYLGKLNDISWHIYHLPDKFTGFSLLCGRIKVSSRGNQRASRDFSSNMAEPRWHRPTHLLNKLRSSSVSMFSATPSARSPVTCSIIRLSAPWKSPVFSRRNAVASTWENLLVICTEFLIEYSWHVFWYI